MINSELPLLHGTAKSELFLFKKNINKINKLKNNRR